MSCQTNLRSDSMRQRRADAMYRNKVPNDARCRAAQSRYIVRTAGEPMYRFWTRTSRGPGHTLLDTVCFRPKRFVEDLRFAAILNIRNKPQIIRQYLSGPSPSAIRSIPPPRVSSLSVRRDVEREYRRIMRRRYIHVKSQYYGIRDNIHRVALTNRLEAAGVRAASCTCQDVAQPCKHMILVDKWLNTLIPRLGLRW